MKEDLQKLVDLQITDTRIRKLKKAIDTADARRAEIELEFEKHASSIREIQDRFENTKLEKAKFENEIAEGKTQLERADRNLKNSQNQKEYEAAMREMDILQRQVSALETQVLEKMAAIEEIEKELAERAEEISSLEGNRQRAIDEFEAELAANTEAYKKENGKRGKVFDTLPANLAKVYNRLVQRSRDGIAVAQVKNESCSACFMKLRPQKIMEIRRGNEIITCENCTLILYIDGAQAAS